MMLYWNGFCRLVNVGKLLCLVQVRKSLMSLCLNLEVLLSVRHLCPELAPSVSRCHLQSSVDLGATFCRAKVQWRCAVISRPASRHQR